VLVYLGRRFLVALPVLWGAATLAFVLVRAAPGDPVDIMLGPRSSGATQAALSAEQREELRRRFGLDQSLPAQYVSWLGRTLRGDLGTSFRTRRPVLDELRQRLPATAMLAGAAFAVNAGLVLALGLAGAAAAGRFGDHVVRAFALVFVAVPPFWLGLLLLWLFAIHLQWVTVAGPPTPQRLVLPALTLGLALSPRGIRVLRASLLEVRSRPYVLYARAKGLAERHVWLRHTFRPALLPAVTLLSINVTGLLTGSVVAESVFAWPGIGLYVVESILVRDYPVVQGYVLLVTTIAIAGSLVADVLYTAVDPRVRTGAGRG
jgi:ABC-type dipeptide/oligopeptide/nickel transport system permease component